MHEVSSGEQNQGLRRYGHLHSTGEGVGAVTYLHMQMRRAALHTAEQVMALCMSGPWTHKQA